VRIAPITQITAVGGLAGIDVVVDSANNLGAFQIKVSFDASLLAYRSGAAGPFLGSTGRSTFCQGPIVGASEVTLTCNSIEASPPGPSGSGTLATYTFEVLTEGTSPIHISQALLATISGVQKLVAVTVDGEVMSANATPPITATPTAMPSPTATATVTLTPTPTAGPLAVPTPGSTSTRCPDFDGDGIVTISDILYVIGKYATDDPQADRDGNGFVTVSDILAVVDHYGERC
jgi:hypothetical protein